MPILVFHRKYIFDCYVKNLSYFPRQNKGRIVSTLFKVAYGLPPYTDQLCKLLLLHIVFGAELFDPVAYHIRAPIFL